jgi:hypothetical protein
MILTLTLSLIAAQGAVQDMTLLGGDVQPVNPVNRATADCDNFNRANGSIGGNWSPVSGSYSISGNMGSGTGTLAYMTNSNTNCAASATKYSVKFGANPSGGLVYVAAMFGISGSPGSNSYFVKIQDQSGTPSYNTYGFYVGNNGGGGSYGTFGTLPLTALEGRIDVYVGPTGQMVMDVDEFDDGSIEQTVMSPGQASAAGGLSNTGFGLGTYGTVTFDDYEVNSGCGGPPAFSLAKAGSCPGPMTLSTANGTANAPVVILYGNAGVFVKPSGACAGITLAISPPNLGVMLNSNGSGAASVSFNASAAFCGKTVQAVDVSSCTASNPIVL